jgi:excisionase family DNA binding protein
MLSTKQAALLLGAHESTVKRWCNSGALSCTYTKGGHRRIDLRTLLDYARKEGIECEMIQFGEDAEAIWKAVGGLANQQISDDLIEMIRDWLMDANSNKVVGLIGTCRLMEVPLAAVFDLLLGRVMQSVGDEWSRGVFEVGEEHRVSECVQDILYVLYADITRRPKKERVGTAVVGTGPGEEHIIGALMVRILLEDLGWDVVYLGRNVPEVDFILFQRKYSADLICLSVTTNREPAEVLRSIHSIRSLDTGDVPFKLAIGGSGASGAQALLQRTRPKEENLAFFSSAVAFSDWAEKLTINDQVR